MLYLTKTNHDLETHIDCVFPDVFVAPAVGWVGDRKFPSLPLSVPLLGNVKDVVYARVNMGATHWHVSTSECLKRSSEAEAYSIIHGHGLHSH